MNDGRASESSRDESSYAEPVDPWADKAASLVPEQAEPIADHTPTSTTPVPPPSVSSPPALSPTRIEVPPPDHRQNTPLPQHQQPYQQPHTSAPPFMPQQAAMPLASMPANWTVPPRPKMPVGEMIAAVVLPLITCSALSWAYFVYAAVRHRRTPQWFVAAAYLSLFILGIVFRSIDPTPDGSDQTTAADTIGVLIFLGGALGAAVHGAVVAAHSADWSREWALREQARRFAATDPARAVQMGIGRPDLSRPFDDGGLVDLNHVPGEALAQVTGLPRAEAHRIVADRLHRGPYQRPDELLGRGLVSEGTMRRLAPMLIAIPPAAAWPAVY